MTKAFVGAILLIFISNSVLANEATSFSEQELKTLSPFDKEVQKKVLQDVVKIMGQKFDPSLEVPELRVSESVKEEESNILEAVESQGMPAWALAKGINMYLFKLNLIVLGEEMKLHNLAHEYAHYVQLKYKKYPVDQFSMDFTEMEVVDVQRKFKYKK